MNTRMQLLCAWSGPAFVLLLGLGWVGLAGYLPPHSPSASAQEIAAIYFRDSLNIRVGMMIGMFATGFYVPWSTLIYVLMRRIEGTDQPVLSLTQLISGALGTTVFLVPAMIWTVAAFRVDNDPEIIRILNDFGWIFLTVVVPPVGAR